MQSCVYGSLYFTASLDPGGVIVLLKELWTIPQNALQGERVSTLVAAISKASAVSASQSFAELLERCLVFSASTIKKQRTAEPLPQAPQ
jgi:hypothetical protein